MAMTADEATQRRMNHEFSISWRVQAKTAKDVKNKWGKSDQVTLVAAPIDHRYETAMKR